MTNDKKVGYFKTIRSIRDFGRYRGLMELRTSVKAESLSKKELGANVSLRWQKNSGHALGYDEISAAREWLSQISIQSINQ